MGNSTISIVTDSTACIPPELATEFGIEIVPVVFIFGKEVFRDGIDMTTTEFYSRLRNTKELPSTSGSLTIPYLEAFQKASQQSNQILCITLSAKFSGMYNSAHLAREMAAQSLPGVIIQILDCRTAAGAQGLVVMAAAKAAAAGKSLSQIILTVRQVIERVNLYAMLDTLNYLVRGGRAPRASAMAASILRIKPILSVQDGEAHPVTNRVTTQKSMQYLFKLVEERTVRDIPLHVVVMHADAIDNGQKLLDRIRTELQPQESWLGEFTPVMGVHTGPGLIAVAFYSGN